jgi:chromosomal replication initiator protein
MGEILDSMNEAHKARQLRIRQAAYKDLTAPRKPRGISFDIILKAVCVHYDVRPEDILSDRRMDGISLPRHMMIYLLCRLTKYTTHQIAPKMGRDQSTIFYAFQKIQNNLNLYQRDVDVLEKQIKELLPKTEL